MEKKKSDSCEICAASVDERSECPCCGHVNSKGIVDWHKGDSQIGFPDQRGRDRNKKTISGKAASRTPPMFKKQLVQLALAAIKDGLKALEGGNA